MVPKMRSAYTMGADAKWEQSTIEMFDTHEMQCKKILNLLRMHLYVPTQWYISMGIYQYNARIYELRNGLYDGIKHSIIAIKKDGRHGFKKGDTDDNNEEQ